jgi:biopolymer transport protein ExbD
MGGKFGSDDDMMADINITPFVDIILVVLIIFMVTAKAIVNDSIKVDLPDAATGEVTETVSLGLTLTTAGALLLDGEEVSTEVLRERLKQAKSDEEDVVCLISADTDVAHGRVVWLIDLIRSEGIGKFAINIDKATMVPPNEPNQDKPTSSAEE